MKIKSQICIFNVIFFEKVRVEFLINIFNNSLIQNK